jgi:phosphoglycolate phosphatase
VIKAVLFDIDGTLLHTGGAGAVAWQRAFLELHEVEANITEHTHAGMTDPEIAEIVFREVMHREGSAEERAQAIGCYLGHLADVVTGNIEAAAHIKLARGDLNRFFTFGGYGSDSRDRTELTKKALERGAEVSGHPLDKAETIAVGDTPRDVRAGHGAGIKVVGVATGSYAVGELIDAGADWSIENVNEGFPL